MLDPHDTTVPVNRLLRLSLARELLAQAIYEHRATAFTLDVPTWRLLTEKTRDGWRQLADVTLEQVKPRARGLPPIIVTGLRPVTGSVIGTIQPSTKDGAA